MCNVIYSMRCGLGESICVSLEFDAFFFSLELRLLYIRFIVVVFHVGFDVNFY